MVVKSRPAYWEVFHPCGLPIIKYEVNQTINLKICRSEGGRSWSNLMPTIGVGGIYLSQCKISCKVPPIPKLQAQGVYSFLGEIFTYIRCPPNTLGNLCECYMDLEGFYIFVGDNQTRLVQASYPFSFILCIIILEFSIGKGGTFWGPYKCQP